ncbi:transmembrane emp24 domain-containing protein 1a [Denticeps clupeoides]|uniref:transmembrane emp24 domain-containing protein 1a n=1 Tax=Denticeps clupeoides TaxID=299321 RepID=UPI0010A33E9D|nr:transmembrane emp24 domain-containing protein 1-like [Denticeps clupeoides]
MGLWVSLCVFSLLLLSVDLALSLRTNQDVDFTFLLPAGSTECFFQSATENSSMEVEYQVIAGSSLDVGFTLISPSGHRLASDFRSADGIHTIDPAENGDYRFCFDNSFAKFSDKMVFVEVILGGPGEENFQAGDWEQDVLLEYRMEDIRDAMNSMYQNLERSRQMQTVLRAFEARDRYLLEDNLWRVSFWSCINLLVVVVVAFTQVFTLRRLFHNKKKICT